MYYSGLSITPFVRLAISLKYPSPTYTYKLIVFHYPILNLVANVPTFHGHLTLLKSSISSPEVRNVL